MKSLFLVLGLLMSTQSFAGNLIIKKIECGNPVRKEDAKVVIERVEDERDISFQVTHLGKQKDFFMQCMFNGANLPSLISCDGETAEGAAVIVNVSSADGVLNMGNLTIGGVHTTLRCSASRF